MEWRNKTSEKNVPGRRGNASLFAYNQAVYAFGNHTIPTLTYLKSL